MPIKLDCPNCGRSLTLPESEAGLPALCNACGHRLIIPVLFSGFDLTDSADESAPFPAPEASGPIASADSTATPAGPVAGSLSGSTARIFVAPAGAPVSLRWPKSPPVRSKGFWASLDESQWTALGVAIACVILLVAVIIVAVPHRRDDANVAPQGASASSTPTDSWESRHSGPMVALINEADTLIVSGDLPAASRKYQELTELVGGRTLTDPVLRAEWNRALAQKQKVTAVLAARALDAGAGPATSPVAIESNAVNPPAVAPEKPWNPDTDPDLTGRVLNGKPAQTQPAAPEHPSPRLARKPSPEDGITDEQIGRAIQKGSNWLLAQYDSRDNHLRNLDASNYPNDMNALCVYALLQCGQAISDPKLELHNERGRIRPLLDAVAALKLEHSAETYGRALRASALALGDRAADRAALKRDFAWLSHAHKAGGYGYNMDDSSAGSWDNSNSQYGLLGVWAGAEVGLDAPVTYWQQVEKHWADCQNHDGTWSYREASPGNQSMTLAGIASLFVAHDYLETPQAAEKVGRPPYTPALARGLAWLEKGDNAVSIDGRWAGYSLYGIERVGLASGFKTFGKHDWYRELATRAIGDQGDDGSWNGDLVHTSYALLFLARGRHPILMNKLRFDGYWANRPRDLANLCRFASRELERPVNWQVVSADSDWTDWNDSPVLYLSSHVEPKLTTDVVDKLRGFVEAGGLLFTQADGGQPGFDEYAQVLAHQLFPQFPMTDVPADHELYKVLYSLDPRPPLKMVSNGSRVLMVHSPEDLSMAWQQRSEKGNPQAFQLGVNLFLYASGKHSLRNRLTSAYLPEMPAPHGESISVSRVRYAGNWNPEPAAWTQFSRWFQGETGHGIEAREVALAALSAKGAAFAHLTGAAAFDTSDAEVNAVRQYVDGGGTLVIDACGGNVAFVESATKFIGHAFPDVALKPVAANSPLLAASAPGMEDLKGPPALRPYAVTKLGRGAGVCEILTHGKGRVLFTSLDITSGLLGARTWGILGYEPAYARAVMKNALLWSGSGARAALEMP